VNFSLNISAGELFELIRPAMLFVAAILSSFVLFHARKRFRNVASILWAVATFVLPAIVFPLYLAVVLFRSKKVPPTTQPKFSLAVPAVYLLTLLAFISVYVMRDSSSADAHLARATQARLAGTTTEVISEYRKALALEDDPHTHSLLANDLEQAGYLTQALAELRLAERQGEPDDTIPFRLGTLLYRINHLSQARLEYERFLETNTCLTSSDRRCLEAARRIQELEQLISGSR
jgi:hypothetical protein